MNDLEIFSRMNAIQETDPLSLLTGNGSKRSKQIAEHRVWLHNIRHERPNTGTRYKIGVYIRYFNQTKYEDYLAYHKKQFFDSISLCPNWELVDFYVDEGSTAPNMESAPEWSRLLCDCMDGKVDLIITQRCPTFPRRLMRSCSVPGCWQLISLLLGSISFLRICLPWQATIVKTYLILTSFRALTGRCFRMMTMKDEVI